MCNCQHCDKCLYCFAIGTKVFQYVKKHWHNQSNIGPSDSYANGGEASRRGNRIPLVSDIQNRNATIKFLLAISLSKSFAYILDSASVEEAELAQAFAEETAGKTLEM